MLEFLGVIAGNVLSLPGILGVALGMTTRSYIIAAILGALVGVAETMIFDIFSASKVDILEPVLAVAVGIVAALLGCAIRRKGATV